MKKALVTGGAGFVGSNLVNKLIEKKIETIVIDNLSSGKKKNLNKKAKFIKGNILNKNLLTKISKNCDVIFHLAAMTNIQESIKDPKNCIKCNIEGTLNVIDACLKNNSKLVFASSSAVYPLQGKKKFDEKAKVDPATPYAISKKTSEDLIFFYKKKINYVILRCFNIYGKNQNLDSLYSAVIPKFIKLAKKKKILELYNGGNQKRDFIYIDDVTDVYIKLAKKKVNGLFNVGSEKAVSIKHLANMIVKKVKYGKIVKGQKKISDAKFSCANISKLKKVLKLNKLVNLSVGLSKIIN